MKPFEISGTVLTVLKAEEGDGDRGHWVSRTFVILPEVLIAKPVAFVVRGRENVDVMNSLERGMFVTVRFVMESVPSRKNPDVYITRLLCMGYNSTLRKVLKPEVTSILPDETIAN